MSVLNIVLKECLILLRKLNNYLLTILYYYHLKTRISTMGGCIEIFTTCHVSSTKITSELKKDVFYFKPVSKLNNCQIDHFW